MGSGGVAIAALPTVICFKVTFSDGLGGGGKFPAQTFFTGLGAQKRGIHAGFSLQKAEQES